MTDGVTAPAFLQKVRHATALFNYGYVAQWQQIVAFGSHIPHGVTVFWAWLRHGVTAARVG